MLCTRKTKPLVSTCVILSGMSNVLCLLYVGWVTNYMAGLYVRVQEPPERPKIDPPEDKAGDTLRIIERLERLESVINQHIQGGNTQRSSECLSAEGSATSQSLFYKDGMKAGTIHPKIGPKMQMDL